MMPPGVDKMIVVIDLREYTLKNAASFSETRQILSILSQHYPERLSTVIMLEAPWVFMSFFKVISPFIDPVTRSKVHFSTLSKKDDNHISNFIPKDTLYTAFGGDSDFVYDDSVYFENVEKFFR
ncbi:Phosphatidylinositol transfer protein (PITP) [Entomophthora muscae]|nr:Phosphatidylinositol transfer protein (PITP) [Entomophthora muscae]